MKRRNHLLYLRRSLVLGSLLLVVGTAWAGLFSVNEKDEVQVAQQLERQVQAKYRVFPQETARLGEMSRRLLGAGPWPKKFADSYSFWVVEDPRDPKILNAFCAPAGFICFYKALYDKLDARYGDDAIAAVLAHEIEHAANHHSARTYENMMEKQMLLGVLLGATRSSNTVANLADFAFGVGKALPYSRGHENEADEKGIVRLWRAGYRVEDMAHVFELFKTLGGDKPPQWLSTHPSDDTRIQRTQQRAQALAQRAPGQALTETSVFHRDGKPFVRAGWVAGVARGVKVIAPNGKLYEVGRSIAFDNAEIRAREEELPEGVTVKLEKPLADPFNQTVGLGSITEVNQSNNSITMDLGRWQQVALGQTFNVVRTRVEEVRNDRGKTERRRVAKPIAAARVKEVHDHDATLEITGFTDAANDRFSMRDVQKGMEVRLTTWPQ